MKGRFFLSLICAMASLLAVATLFDNAGLAKNTGVVEAAPREVTQGALRAKGGFFTLRLQPPERVTAADVSPKELVFVFDTSMGTWQKMSRITLFVFLILLVMSIWSIVIVVVRYLTFRAARAQSREFAQKVSSSLRNRKVDEAISLSDKYKKSHLAVVVNAGLQEFCAHQSSSDISGVVLDAPERALRRATAIKTSEFRRGLSGLATIGATAPLVGLFGTTFGIIDAIVVMGESASTDISGIAPGIAEALAPTAFGLAVAVPAVWLFNYFSAKVDNFVVEMDNSSAELINFFLKQRGEKNDD